MLLDPTPRVATVATRRGWQDLEELYDQGVLRSLGVSNFDLEELMLWQREWRGGLRPGGKKRIFRAWACGPIHFNSSFFSSQKVTLRCYKWCLVHVMGAQEASQTWFINEIMLAHQTFHGSNPSNQKVLPFGKQPADAFGLANKEALQLEGQGEAAGGSKQVLHISPWLGTGAPEGAHVQLPKMWFRRCGS